MRQLATFPTGESAAIRSLLLLCLSPTLALAHHSRAEFNGEVQELDGELVDVVWANPHPTFAPGMPATMGSPHPAPTGREGADE